ncbi:hypothetical protein [Mumia zhuanghuii]|uniref:Uncharacterized protein n=1 Tax=Mumia zhuanghuii TaxID=2585211 RepID=A0A5C4LS42_9ACTN|nr:hypothetical protein [Mumia zhuanghuii]TNC21772.1 hypothetical protein FHE65_36315 [Mumia zhuanghuii]
MCMTRAGLTSVQLPWLVWPRGHWMHPLPPCERATDVVLWLVEYPWQKPLAQGSARAFFEMFVRLR